jgi:hypothetical protein
MLMAVNRAVLLAAIDGEIETRWIGESLKPQVSPRSTPNRYKHRNNNDLIDESSRIFPKY